MYFFYTLIGIAVIILGLDIWRHDDSNAEVIWISLLLPALYYIVFLLGPIFTSLNESRPVPERVIFK